MKKYMPPLKGEGDRRQAVERSFGVIFYVVHVYLIFAETPQSVLRTASSPFRGALFPLSVCHGNSR